MEKLAQMKYYESPRWTYEVTDCSMPMTFDTYNKCSYNCLYCFSYFQKSIGDDNAINYQTNPLYHVDTNKIKEMFELKRKTSFAKYIMAKKVMQWGGLSDQFDEYERKNGITLELLRFFKTIKYPICFSTKGEWWVYDDRYIELFRDADYWNFKFSIINLDERKAKIIEKGVSSPEKRLLAIKELSKYKTGGTTLRLRPFIIGYSNFNDEHIELIRKAGEYGATALSTEFFCLEGRAQPDLHKRYKEMSAVMGFDLYNFYKNYSTGQGYYRLNRELKRKYVDEMQKACDKAGMRFYVSDAHFKERCANGSCCGLGDNWNYSRGQMTEALLIAKAKGRVTWSDIATDMEHLKGWKFGLAINTKSSESKARKGDIDMYEFLRRTWNSPNNSRSPYKYFGGILYPVGKDISGDVIYEYREG